jgi:hypothetical protein
MEDGLQGEIEDYIWNNSNIASIGMVVFHE